MINTIITLWVLMFIAYNAYFYISYRRRVKIMRKELNADKARLLFEDIRHDLVMLVARGSVDPRSYGYLIAYSITVEVIRETTSHRDISLAFLESYVKSSKDEKSDLDTSTWPKELREVYIKLGLALDELVKLNSIVFRLCNNFLNLFGQRLSLQNLGKIDAKARKVGQAKDVLMKDVININKAIVH